MPTETRADGGGREDDQRPGPRAVTDARTLRALAHPVRIALIEALTYGGPMTATEVGEQIGETPTTCSFHLRQLAKYGFVEEAGGGRGRSRPWRMTRLGLYIPGPPGDPASAVAARTVGRLLTERWLGRYQAWLDTRSSYPLEWRQAVDFTWVFYLTAAEPRQLSEELTAWFQERTRARFGERLTDPAKRPPGSLPVEMLVFSYPMSPPPGPSGGGTPGSEAAGSDAHCHDRRGRA
jgi:DNA-binding transcriptional ArsR family regulator